MNRMKEVAELLGLKLNEEFKINGQGEKYHFEKDGVHSSVEKVTLNHLLPNLILGKYEIVKEPWKPTNDDVYFVIVTFYNSLTPMRETWHGTAADYTYLAAGNYFQTCDEAEKAIPWFNANIERLNRGESWEVKK